MKLSRFKDLVALEKEKIVISIGDAGAIFSYFENHKLSIRLYAAAPSPEDTASILDMLKNNPEVPVMMVVDVMDQSYTKQTLPAVGKLSINKLVKQRLKREFGETDLTGFIKLGRDEKGRKDWNFIFISVPSIYPLSQWVEFLNAVPNKFEGIYLLPVESVKMIREVVEKIAEREKRKPAEWKMLVTHNKIGGFRQVVTKKNQIVFTRMISGGQDTIPDILAGSIEQEVQNTMEYIRRLSYDESSSLDMVIVVSEDIKASIDPNKLRASSVTLYTPYEFGSQVGFNSNSHRSDKFADSLMASYIVKHKRKMRLTTPEMRKVSNIYLMKGIIKKSLILFIPLFLSYVGYTGYKTWNIMDAVKSHEQNWNSIQAVYDNELLDFNQQNEGMSLEMATKVNNMAKLYVLLSGGDNNPLTIISQFGKIKNNQILVQEFSWEYLDTGLSEGGSQQAQNFNNRDAGGTDSSQIKVTIRASINSRGVRFQELFDNFDDFISRVESEFRNYNVDYSRLPSKINLNRNISDIPITISIMGPVRERE